MKLPALLIAGFVAAGVALFCIVAGFVFAGLRRANLAWAASLLAWFFLAAAAAQIERMAVPANQITNLAGDGRLDLVSRCAGAEFCAPILCGCPGDFVTTSISRKSSRRANGDGLAANVLKVPQHGGKTSSTPPFLDAVQPAIAALSVGEANPFGHPSPEAVERILAEGTRLYRTDKGRRHHGNYRRPVSGRRLILYLRAAVLGALLLTIACRNSRVLGAIFQGRLRIELLGVKQGAESFLAAT
jgi:hypothetical protein